MVIIEHSNKLKNFMSVKFYVNYIELLTGADIIYNALRSVDVKSLKNLSVEIKSFMDENIKDKVRVLSSIIDSEKIDFTVISLKSKHPQWFEGIII